MEKTILNLQGEPVKVEKWRWVACFTDGSELKQFDIENNRFHSFAEIKETGKEVQSFKMVSENYPRGFNLLIPVGADLIHYYRVTRLNIGTPQYREEKYYIFGWKINDNGRVFKRLLKIYPDDYIAIMDDDGRGDL